MYELKVKNAAGDENGIVFAEDGAVSLYHDNYVKIATSSSGATVSGTLAATGFTGQASATAFTFDYDNLPTSDPNVKGRMWLQNYGTGKALMISDG